MIRWTSDRRSKNCDEKQKQHAYQQLLKITNNDHSLLYDDLITDDVFLAVGHEDKCKQKRYATWNR